MADVLTVTLDHAQQRLKSYAHRIALLGSELAAIGARTTTLVGNGTMIAPVINTLILQPKQLDQAWYTSNAGAYVKPDLTSGYNVNTSGKWKEFPREGGPYIECHDSAGEWARTSANVGTNRGISLSFWPFSTGVLHIVLDCGWAPDTWTFGTDFTVGLRFWSDGSVEVWKGGEHKGTYNFGGAMTNMVHTVILPCRRRELLVFGNTGQNFVHVFDDIDENETAPEITPDERFYVYSNGGSIQTQFCPLTFPTSGYSVSTQWVFADAPPEGASLYNGWVNDFSAVTNAGVYGVSAFAGTTDVSTVELLATDGVSAFVPNGETHACRVKTTLTSGGTYTPFVWGLVIEYMHEVWSTPGADFDLTPFVMEASLSVPDDPFGDTYSVTCTLGLEEVVDSVDVTRLLLEEVPNIETQSYRPVLFKIGDTPYFDGFIRRPRFIDGLYDQVKRLEFEVHTLAALMEKVAFDTRLPLDNLPLCRPVDEGSSAVSVIFEQMGFPTTRLRLSTIDYNFGGIPHAQCEEWAYAIEVGTTGMQAIEQVMRFASDAVYGTHPGLDGAEFWVLSREDYEAQESVITVYRDIADVETNEPGITDPIEQAERLYDGWREETMELEANIVRATGLNPRTGAIIQSYARDEASIDAELDPASRPSNWCGFPLPVGVSARQFRRQEDTDRCVEGLLPIATQQGTIGEFDANTILLTEDGLPVWRMDKITLDGIGERFVTSLSAHHVKEVADDNGRIDGYHDRRAHYTVGTILGHGGTTIADIQAIQRQRLAQQFITDLQRSPLFATGILSTNRVSP